MNRKRKIKPQVKRRTPFISHRIWTGTLVRIKQLADNLGVPRVAVIDFAMSELELQINAGTETNLMLIKSRLDALRITRGRPRQQPKKEN